MSRRADCALLGAVVATLVFALLLHVHLYSAHAARAVDDLGQLGAALVACAACGWRGSRSHDRTRAAWLLLSVATGAWAVGEILWSYDELLLDRQTPFPSMADAGYLTFSVVAVIALLSWPSAALHGAARWRALLDGALVAGSLFVISWTTALGETVRAGGDSRWAATVSLAYPVLDLVLITVALTVFMHARTTLRSGFGLIAVGLAFLCVADSGFAYLSATGSYATGNPVDVGWFAGFLLIAAAAASARPPSADETGRGEVHESQVKALLPYIPVTLGLAVAVGNQLVGDRDRLAMIGATLVMAVLLIRQLLVVLDNRLLLARLLSTQHELRHQAFHDPLTGLANRSLFADRLRHGLALHQRDLRHVSLLYCDLDAFKAINDTYGHDTGDAVIKAAAERLRAVTRVSDTVARLGGDEFAILLEDGADPQTVALNIVDAFAQPASIAQISIPMAISVGIAELNPSDTPVTPEVLLHRADTAMYYAKRQQSGSAVAWSVRLEANYVS